MSFRKRREQLFAFAKRVGSLFIKTHILTIWLVLCVVGYVVGTQGKPEAGTGADEELFENLRVLSYRDAPSDSAAHFVVELSARGKAFRQYDVDARRFVPVTSDHEYWRAVTGTTYAPVEVRGRVHRGVWLEMPASSTRSPLPEQYDELYQSTMNLVSPLSMVASAVGMLSGYSVGHRLATWRQSLSSPEVQERLLARPNFGRSITREAWRRVALEPALVFDEKDPAHFAATSARQRLYTNFFKLAAHDPDGFIPYEAARLDSAGATREARAMRAFAAAVTRASQDTVHLSSADFSAVEEWASLLDRRGHWANGTIPPTGITRIQCLGALAWFGLAPESVEPRRVWVGPRLLLREGEKQAFIPDEVPRITAACPVAWREWLGDDGNQLGAFAWTAQWMRDVRRWAPALGLGTSDVKTASVETDARPPSLPTASAPSTASARRQPDASSHGMPLVNVETSRADSAIAGSADSVRITIEPQGLDSTVLRSSLGVFGR
jgi:hypothetical protein